MVSVVARQESMDVATTLTGKDGSFNLNNLNQEGTYDFYFSYVGYETYVEKNIVLKKIRALY
ncbi:carboxypeptidase-like regulatory domain-containing protein [Niabella ginsengisoli]|uniref:Carboxypeptidase-like regulatory domain-containing protein n=1 Tax=Niabella ginsengisoli TaxID=522298 RepID=A0ABS9SDM7_9BACT|nr:carboxypeptidase-like regulatory domain-containing protein [Niabella ginsengisoli]MCH5596443.1 carboxypeptidase-like regulatory domain-containing protein [Niabella ginsengisoli]